MSEFRKNEQQVSAQQARRELALRQMNEVLAKYPGIAVELGKGNGQFLLFQGSVQSERQVAGVAEDIKIRAAIESRLLLTQAGYRTWDFITYPDSPTSNYELSSERLDRILAELGTSSDAMKSIVQTSINYEIDERGEHLNMSGQAVGGNTEVRIGSGDFTQITRPTPEVVTQLLDTAKKKVNIEKPITPEETEMQEDIDLMESIQF